MSYLEKNSVTIHSSRAVIEMMMNFENYNPAIIKSLIFATVKEICATKHILG